MTASTIEATDLATPDELRLANKIAIKGLQLLRTFEGRPVPDAWSVSHDELLHSDRDQFYLSHFFNEVAPQLLEVGLHDAESMSDSASFYSRALWTIRHSNTLVPRQLRRFRNPIHDREFLSVHEAAVGWAWQMFVKYNGWWVLPHGISKSYLDCFGPHAPEPESHSNPFRSGFWCVFDDLRQNINEALLVEAEIRLNDELQKALKYTRSQPSLKTSAHESEQLSVDARLRSLLIDATERALECVKQFEELLVSLRSIEEDSPRRDEALDTLANARTRRPTPIPSNAIAFFQATSDSLRGQTFPSEYRRSTGFRLPASVAHDFAEVALDDLSKLCADKSLSWQLKKDVGLCNPGDGEGDASFWTTLRNLDTVELRAQIQLECERALAAVPSAPICDLVPNDADLDREQTDLTRGPDNALRRSSSPGFPARSNDERDAWMYQLRSEGVPIKAVQKRLKQEHPDWDYLEAPQSVTAACRRWAKRYELPWRESA